MVDISTLGMDPDLRDNGVWVTPEPMFPEFQVKLRSVLSELAQKAARAIDDPELILGFVNDPKNPAGRQKAADGLSECYVVDWRGITEGDEPLPWSTATGKQWFGREDWLHILQACLRECSNHGRFARAKAHSGN